MQVQSGYSGQQEKYMLNQQQRDQVIAIAKQAGDAIMKVYREGDFQVESKGDNSPLTRADLAAHKVITAGLQQLSVQYPVLSEESDNIPWSERQTWQTYWLVDPLDGTKEFIKRNGEFTVNIALIHQGEPVFGVVYAPVLDEMYWGMVGGITGATKGATNSVAYCNDQQIHAKSSANRETLTVVGSRSHQSAELTGYLEQLGKPYELVAMGSSLKICLVACGEADLYPRLGPTCEWDTAAAHAVALAAGAQVTEIAGAGNNRPLRYNQKESLLNPHFLVAASS
ncbi:3'(2'),5'-bisphosphate nucleotidase [Pseudidiomarina planktonica]|uniref:3'(2'),5'-bisphosphate nucleotidase CysQ n=2 Tax=Pseudidiomarina planktonica TaxID=1323738 RepID=A0A1Y6EHC8_9GAMM|nr:3'(2'),5'-bisphosphate nucleotidase [Pseudidiomarina planktonica]